MSSIGATKKWTKFHTMTLLAFALVAPPLIVVNPDYVFNLPGDVRFDMTELVDVMEGAQREYVFEHEGDELRVTLTIDDLDTLRQGSIDRQTPMSLLGLDAWACGSYRRSFVGAADACSSRHALAIPFSGRVEGTLTRDGVSTPFERTFEKAVFEHAGRSLFNGLFRLEDSGEADQDVKLFVYWNEKQVRGDYASLCFEVTDPKTGELLAGETCPGFEYFDDWMRSAYIRVKPSLRER